MQLLKNALLLKQIKDNKQINFTIMKTLITFLAIIIMATVLKAQSQCEAFITATMNETTIACQGSYFVNGQQITDSSIVNYSWVIDNTTLSGETITWSFQEEGLHMVCLTASGYGCSSTVCDSIFTGNGQTGCNLGLTYEITHATDANTADGAIDITVSGGTEPYSYYWADGQTSQNIEGLYPGVYTVAVSDSNNCNLTWSFNVMAFNNDSTTVDTVFDNLYAGAYYYFQSEEDCSATVYVEAYGGTAPYSYNWSNEVSIYSFDNACGDDFYCVTVTDALGETAEACVFVQYYDYGQDTIWNVNDTLEVVINDCLGEVDNAEIIGFIVQNGYIIVNWEFTGADDNSTILTVTYAVEDSVSEGIYQITLYVNCGDEKSLSTYNDRILVTANDITGIKNIDREIAGQLYPNPVVNELNIELNAAKADNITLQVYNYSGQLVYSGNDKLNTGNNNVKLDASQLSSGVYIVKISGNNVYKTMRFVK